MTLPRCQVFIPDGDVKEVVERSLEQLFINAGVCRHTDGKLIMYSKDEIIKVTRDSLSFIERSSDVI